MATIPLGNVPVEAASAMLAANGNLGDSVTYTHGFGNPPVIDVLKQVGATWADATGTFDVTHNVVPGSSPQAFESVTVTNTTDGALTFLVRLTKAD